MVAGLFILVSLAQTQTGTSANSVAAVCRDYPERVKALFAALDLDRAGLEAVKKGVSAGDYPRACEELLAYYRRGKTASWLRRTAPRTGTGRDSGADAILDDTFTEYTISAKAPRKPDGRLDWSYNGPQNDREWGWGLNRHAWATQLVNAFFATGNLVYVEGFDRLTRDWIVSNSYPGTPSSTPQWRGLEVYFRVGRVWPKAFYALQDIEAFTPATRILLLSSVPEHAHYARNFHASGGNWITMEMFGLAAAGVCWPEFKDAEEWYRYATTRIVPELTAQVYPDGVQKELTSSYHRVALHNFSDMAELAAHAKRPLPEDFRNTIERMNNYIAYSMEPNGCAPLNNDSDLNSTRDEVRAAAGVFERPDWLYIATNGKEGDAPKGSCSIVFPWAGQAIMRSGWDADAHWAFFDGGPIGIGHWHLDKLHLSISAFGRDILVDGGRYTYQPGPWRRHFMSSLSHNVTLIDGKGQKPYDMEASAPIQDSYAITPEYDFVRGDHTVGYEDVEGSVAHTRAVAYLRGQYFLVVDRITTDRPRTIQALWHFHPLCTVALNGAEAQSVDEGQGNVRIVPVAPFVWGTEIVKGQTEPVIQGWWSREYNVKEASQCVVYSADISKTETFAWVIMPGKGNVPPVRAEITEATESGITIHVAPEGANPKTLTIPLRGDCGIASVLESRK
jgi:hypothetical protein